jgi:hypothetical protein
VGFFPFLLVTNTPPIPVVSNLAAAQAINPAAPFTLRWAPWTGASTNDRISLAIVSPSGDTVVSAATDCAGEFPLPAGASSFEIPAGELSGGTVYRVHLTFGGSLFGGQDDSALQVLRGLQSRTTRAEIRTSGASGGETATLGSPQIEGTNVVMTIEGVPGGVYQLQSTTNLSDWLNEQSITLPASGRTNVVVPIVAAGQPRFYRAILIDDGGGPGGDAANLAVSLTATNSLRIVVTGTPGAAYTVEASTNYVAWTRVQEVLIPAGTNQVTVEVAIATNQVFAIYRAVTAEGPPPTGDGPTLALTRETAGLRLVLSDGEPQRTYVIQKTEEDFAAWTDTTLTVTADPSGGGNVAITPAAGEPTAFYRALAR